MIYESFHFFKSLTIWGCDDSNKPCKYKNVQACIQETCIALESGTTLTPIYAPTFGSFPQDRVTSSIFIVTISSKISEPLFKSTREQMIRR